jgi:hypothetical protein
VECCVALEDELSEHVAAGGSRGLGRRKWQVDDGGRERFDVEHGEF